MKIGILGYNGFVGNAVYNYFKKVYNTDVVGISKNDQPIEYLDVLINCAGTSKKYYAEKNPNEDETACKNLIFKIYTIKCNSIIHISSIDALNTNIVYGRNKLWVEDTIKGISNNWSIIRLSGLVGNNLKKNVVYDIANNNKIWVSENSVYNYININLLPIVINKHIKTDNKNVTFNYASSKNISAKEIATIFNKNIEYGDREEFYDSIDINYIKNLIKVHSSYYYINNYKGTI